MRRTGATVSLVLLLVSLTAVAGAATWTVADDFESGDYSGSTGSQPWIDSWTEVGESDGARQGSVQVTGSGCSGSCLHIAPLLAVTAVGAARQVDLTEATAAELSYAIDFPSGFLVVGQAKVAWLDGNAWATLKTHPPGTEGVFRVPLPVGRRVTISLQAAELSVESEMRWDDIVIEYAVTETTTTTTSTSTSTTLLPVTVPTVTVPTVTLLTTTTTTTAPNTSTTATTTSTATTPPSTTDRSTTTTTTPVVATTSTTVSPTTTVAGTSTTEPPTAVPEDPADDSLTAGPPPSQTFGVITGIEPGLAPPALDITAQRGFVVDFLLSAEDLRLDLAANLVVGLVLAWLSVKGLDRRQS